MELKSLEMGAFGSHCDRLQNAEEEEEAGEEEGEERAGGGAGGDF